MSDLLTITDVSRRSGVASSALRFYESRGLIASERAGSGHRRYPRAVLRRVAFIVFAQKIGLSLTEVGAELARLPQNRVPERADWAKLSGTWTKAHQSTHRRARALARGPWSLHRVRLPVAAALPAGQSRGSRRARGAGAEVLDWEGEVGVQLRANHCAGHLN